MAATATGVFHARTKTQRVMKERLLRLTHPASEGEGEWSLTDRSSAHARDSLRAWQREGVIEEVKNKRLYYTTCWRVTERGMDAVARHEARVVYIAECLEQIAEQSLIAGAARAALVGAADAVAAEARRAVDFTADSATIQQATSRLRMPWFEAQQEWGRSQEAMRLIGHHRAQIEQECARAADTGEDVARIMADASARGGGDCAADDGDPLGGDA